MKTNQLVTLEKGKDDKFIKNFESFLREDELMWGRDSVGCYMIKEGDVEYMIEQFEEELEDLKDEEGYKELKKHLNKMLKQLKEVLSVYFNKEGTIVRIFKEWGDYCFPLVNVD